MTTNADTETLLILRIPAIRHLAWLCTAPQLLAAPVSFDPLQWLPDDYRDKLKHWDKHPDTMPARLAATTERRLGHYFERLYEVLLVDLLGWDLVLKNQQIRAGNQTIGELDFLVRNVQTGNLEHHEIAIKYYLGMNEEPEGTRWYGPNARDRLDLKVGRILSHQSPMAQRAEAQVLLANLGITETITPRVFMPGYLFYPEIEANVPDYVPREHLRGRWCYARELASSELTGWVPLKKPHWIGPWIQSGQPDAGAAREAADFVEAKGVPVLFAEMEWQPGLGCWVERQRWFVVPGEWPLGPG
ncbi:MAG: hypothetical protein HLUCCX14_10300 [Marinobacter excellens HL-55]|uniref:DUF1853 family protein n=1 Tax=Marinobacter excellens HL-55 TaxID=1305731 RepID=A0A0N8KKM1_9GAMM|nr:MAG: hypothetical protein HLUCCX14_10300 [Marinobacter excellens HL-55]